MTINEVTERVEVVDILAAKKGDEEAILRLLDRYEPLLAHTLRRFSDNEAVLQDLRQETYLEIYRSLPGLKYEEAFPCWMRQLALRVGYRHWSGQAKEARAKSAYMELLEQCTPLPSRFADGEDLDHIKTLLARMETQDRSILEMRYLEGVKTAEIASYLGWSPTRVRVRIHRALKRLRDLYEKYPALPADTQLCDK